MLQVATRACCHYSSATFTMLSVCIQCTDTTLHQIARTAHCRLVAGENRRLKVWQQAVLGLCRCCAPVNYSSQLASYVTAANLHNVAKQSKHAAWYQHTLVWRHRPKSSTQGGGWMTLDAVKQATVQVSNVWYVLQSQPTPHRVNHPILREIAISCHTRSFRISPCSYECEPVIWNILHQILVRSLLYLACSCRSWAMLDVLWGCFCRTRCRFEAEVTVLNQYCAA